MLSAGLQLKRINMIIREIFFICSALRSKKENIVPWLPIMKSEACSILVLTGKCYDTCGWVKWKVNKSKKNTLNIKTNKLKRLMTSKIKLKGRSGPIQELSREVNRNSGKE